MQSWFSKKEFWPLVIYLFKSVRHFSVIRTVSNSKRWFYKKLIFKEFNVISNSVSVENLKTIDNLISIFIYKSLKSIHNVNLCIKSIPKEPLISYCKTIFTNITWKPFLFCFKWFTPRRYAYWPAIFPSF